MPTRILIADDNPIFRKALRNLLEGVHQWEVFEACDGEDAISKSVDLRPNVVLLDLAMPVKDGLTAAREISQLLPETPILMCTMHVSANLELEAKKSGVRAVLSKSDGNLLVSTVQAFTEAQPVPQLPVTVPILPTPLRTTPTEPAPPSQMAETIPSVDSNLPPQPAEPENVS
jgi:CheY-like chemotaxis protein